MSNFEAHKFFTVYLSKYCSQKMCIPPNGIVFPNQLMFATATVILRNCNCQCWQVEVNNCAGKMYFDKGWRKFIHENNIEEKHILVFINHGGSSVFDVTVFGANNCTKIVSPRVSKEQEVEFVDLVDDDEEEEEEKEEEQEQDEEWNDEGTNSMKGEDKELDIERYINHPNPYFVVKKSSAGRENELVCFLLLVLISYINELGLPAQMVPNNVIRVHELTLEDKEDITFIGLHNQKTIGKVKKWKDGRTVITGWSNFCYKNMVNLQFKTCICEFLPQVEQDDAGQRTKQIKVHIIRKKHTPMA